VNASEIDFLAFASRFQRLVHACMAGGVIKGTSVTSGYKKQLLSSASFEASTISVLRQSWQKREHVAEDSMLSAFLSRPSLALRISQYERNSQFFARHFLCVSFRSDT
jgi:hypothetical protein